MEDWIFFGIIWSIFYIINTLAPFFCLKNKQSKNIYFLDTTDGHLDLSHGSHQQQDLSYLEGELADLELSGLQSLPANLTITTGISSKENAVTISIG